MHDAIIAGKQNNPAVCFTDILFSNDQAVRIQAHEVMPPARAYLAFRLHPKAQVVFHPAGCSKLRPRLLIKIHNHSLPICAFCK